MPNSLLTPTQITRKALMILHQKCNFLGNINRQYDDQFAKSGGAGITRGKIGPTLRIRQPNEYVVRDGLVMEAQSQNELYSDLTVSTVKGVDMYFGSDELTLTIDDFSERYIDPAMSVLAASIEADVLVNVMKDVYNLVDADTVAFGFNHIVDAKTKLTDNLAPQGNRKFLLNTTHANKFLKDTKSLTESSTNISEQYREGIIGRTGGFDHYENTLLVPHQTGDAAKTTTVSVDGTVTANGSTQITVTNGSSKTFKKGDVFTIADTYRVHPETKVSTGRLQDFVVTEDAASTTLKFSPAIYTSGGRQNIAAVGIVTGKAIVKVGAGANETLTQSLAFHKDAFTFVTADLEQPKGVDFSAREVMDGISMSLVRDFAISDRSFPCRLDVLYGYKTLRAALATRVHADGA